MLAVVLFVRCFIACAAALNLGQFVDDAAAVAWAAAAVAIVWPGPASADAPVHVAV